MIGLVKYVHLFNISLNVMGVTNHFLIGFEVHLHKMELTPGTINGAKNLLIAMSYILGENLLLVFS